MARKKPVASPEDEASGEVAKWVAEIQLYEKESQSWVTRSKKIIKRYKDDRGANDKKARYNILWSNIQTLHPALYASVPKPNIDRRFQDDDDLGRISAQVLERSVTYFVHTELFDSVMKQSVLDRLLPGRGTAWVRYVPEFKDATVQGTEEVQEQGVSLTDDVVSEGAEPEQELYSEEVLVDYVHWEDFGHTYGRTWEEVGAVWKKAYLSRTELIKRFGEEIGKSVPLDHSPTKLDDSKADERLKKATVYEIWDKVSKEAVWVHKDVKNPLDKKTDPLGLKEFFPCPKPMFATLANDSVIPVPDYVLYQDQAQELDDLTARIRAITKALKVAGVYDSAAEGVQRLLSEGAENTLIPVSQWAVFGEKGGLQGVINFLPIKEISEVLMGLHDSREKVKAVIYEITGISDIIRGASDPSETLGAQELKGKYAGLRLDDKQKDVARFGCDLVRIMTEIIAEHFSMDTIKQVSGVKLLTAQEKQMYQMQMQPPMPGAPPAPPPQIPEGVDELMKLPTWEDIEKVIRNDAARCFRIDIETDSTIKIDQEADKQARMELLTAAGGFIQQAATVQNPDLQPLLMEMLMFGLRGFKVGRELETTFKTAIDKMRQAADNPQPQKNPEVEAAQAQAQADAQALQGKMQADAQKHQMDMTKQQGDMHLQAVQAQQAEKLAQMNFAIKQIDVQLKQMDLALKDKDLEIKKQELKKPKTQT